MKKLKIVSIIVSCLMFVSVAVFALCMNLKPANNELDEFYEFESRVAAACSQDDYSVKSINKSGVMTSSVLEIFDCEKVESVDCCGYVNKQTGDIFETTVLTNLSNVLNFDEIREIADDLGFVVYEANDEYCFYSKYALKRLIVIGQLNNSFGATSVINGYKNYNILCFETERETKIAYESLKAQGVEVYIDLIVTKQTDDDNPYELYNSWGAEAMEIAGYRDYLLINGSGNDVVVAVLDSGLNTSHEMFESRTIEVNDAVVGYSYYDSKYTYSGYDFEDDDGHGTHVSGIICDLTPENVKILPIKVFNNLGKGSSVNIMAALERVYSVYSVNYNIACINMSLGGGYYASGYTDYYNIFEDLRDDRSVLPVVAAGNESDNTSNYLPAACENAIVVSAVANDNGTYYFDESYSNYGIHVDVAAPGSDINSAFIASSNSAGVDVYEEHSGTSMATPHVSAVVALLCCDKKYYDGNTAIYTADEIEDALKENVKDYGSSGFDVKYGYGMVNLSYYSVERVSSKIQFYHDSALIDTSAGYHNFNDSMNLNLVCEDPSLEIYYTDDGNLPAIATAQKYDSTITVTKTCKIMAVAYEVSGEEVLKATEIFEAKLFSANEPLENYFTITTAGIVLTYSGHFTELTVPEIIDGYQVKGISPSVFKGTELVSVELPESCTALGGYIFQDCLDLERVVAPGVETLYDSAFSNCPKIEYISSSALEPGQKGLYLPKLKTTSGYAFAYNNGLKQVYLEKLEQLGSADFLGCANLEVCEIMSATNIPEACFYDCVSLKSFVIGKDVQEVGNFAFYDSGVTNIIVNASNDFLVTDGRALYDSNSLVYYYSVNGGSYTVLSQANITGRIVTITEIADCSMMYANFDELVIPETITYIGANCLYDASIGTLVYKPVNAGYEGYVFVYDNSIAVAFPFGYTYVQNLVIDAGVEEVPLMLFQGMLVNNVYVQAFETVFQSGSLSCDYIERIYFEFDDTIMYSYMNYFASSDALYHDPVLFAKKLFSGFGITGYECYGMAGEYNIYSIEDLTGMKFIDFDVYDVVVNHDEQEHNIAVFVDDAVQNHTIAYGLTAGSYDISSIENNPVFINRTVGTPIYFKISADGYFDAYGSATLTIKNADDGEASITIHLQNQYCVYGEEIEVDSSQYYIEADFFVMGVALRLSTNAVQGDNVGEYQIISEIISDGGYIVNIIPAKFMIEQRAVEITIGSDERTYGSTIDADEIGYQVTKGSIYGTDDLGVKLKTEATNESNIGTYDVEMHSYSNKNYDIKAAYAGKLFVTQRDLTYNIENQVATYGLVNIDLSKFSIQTGTIVNGDDLGIQLYTMANNTSSAGAYYIYMSVENENYNVSYEKGVLTINPRPITITIEDQIIYYGAEITQFGTAAYAVTSGSIVGDDNLNVEIMSTATKESDVGTYELDAKYNNSNYAVTVVKGKVVISPLVVKIQLLQQEVTYGETLILDRDAYSIVKGTILAGDSLDLELSTDATETSDAGVYVITGKCNSKNYDCEVLDGALVINKRVIHISLNNQKVDYSDNIKIKQDEYEIIMGEVVYGDDLMIEIKPHEDVEEMLEGKTYKIVGISYNSNYEVIFFDAEISINEKTTSFEKNLTLYVILGVVGLALFGVVIFLGRRRNKEEDFK